ncbi:hypothetical protein CERSUDRAFT_124889 [Gelatoporia subvermispora B]|uniref:Uncharacterized protein n=1 Tax=Ceriporiopsis subvermispora (strain B) TaxID=914234 RepID=M2RB47_CERS8|nr:hypothetical protein CERSUDRAFT_124889 [Gelatoporia subvermispora B]
MCGKEQVQAVDVLQCIALLDLNLSRRLILPGEALAFLENNAPRDLSSKLMKAYEKDDYIAVQHELLTLVPNSHVAILRTRIEKFHDVPFRGDSQHGLIAYLVQNDEHFVNPRRSPRGRQGKFCSVVQSSASGKSRTIVEIGAHGIFVVYISLRPAHDLVGYPFRDDFPAQVLLYRNDDKPEYEYRCHCFFRALFITFGRKVDFLLETVHDDYAAAVRAWHKQMCGTDWLSRTAFFEDVKKEYQKLLGDPSISIGFSSILLDLRTKFAQIFDGSHYPKLVVALDNAEELKWRSNAGHSLSEVVCNTIARYSMACPESIWVIFSSTDPAVADFNIGYKPYIGSSLRIAVPGDDIYPPFTLLGWDQFAPPSVCPTRDLALLSHLVQFGRPLTVPSIDKVLHRWTNLIAECDTYSALMTESTLYMLGNIGTYDPTNHMQSLALLSQRFCIQTESAHPIASHFIDVAISKHLCTCVERADNGTWIRGAYPSEPFLSHVVAHILHNSIEDDVLLHSLETLLQYFSSRAIIIEPHGDLVPRLLWLLCKDFLVKELLMSADSASDAGLDSELPFSKILSLTIMLEAMFGADIWPDGPSGIVAKDALKDAYINISHWIQADSDSAESPDTRATWMSYLWVRSAGAQCHLQQVPVRQIVPIWYDTSDTNTFRTGAASSCMSQVLICSRVGEDPTPSFLFDAVTLERYGLAGNMPYVVILLDLGCRPTAIHTTFESTAGAPRLLIHATGISRETFPFLGRSGPLEQLMKDVAALNTVSRHPVPFVDDLYDGVLFGSTVESSHMDWERQGHIYSPLGVTASI